MARTEVGSRRLIFLTTFFSVRIDCLQPFIDLDIFFLVYERRANYVLVTWRSVFICFYGAIFGSSVTVFTARLSTFWLQIFRTDDNLWSKNIDFAICPVIKNSILITVTLFVVKFRSEPYFERNSRSVAFEFNTHMNK